MKLGLSAWFLAVLAAAAVAQIPIQNEDIRGEWSGPYDFPTLLTFANGGGIDSICRSTLPPACEAQLPSGTETVVITNNTISLSFTTLVGVTTPELSAQRLPACAAAGIFPVQTITPLPPAQILAYDPFIGSVTFVDPRRLNDPNCVFVSRVDVGGQRRIRVQYLLTSTGMSLNQNVATGPRLGCSAGQGQCVSQVDDDEVLSAIVNIDFTIPCVSGDCLN
eukprot:g4619.t1